MGDIVLVLDGFGIGAMPDAGELRKSDVEAHTLKSLTEWSRAHRSRDLDIGYLTALGLNKLCPGIKLSEASEINDFSAGLHSRVHRLSLGYPGADTFAGHQTLMGADMSKVVVCPLIERVDEVQELLESQGYSVRWLAKDKANLVVDDHILIHDNLEADPGLNWNVSARLSDVTWDKLMDVSKLVRQVAPVARVICVGGYSEKTLDNYTHPGSHGTYGLDTPMTGFYVNGGLQVVHLGLDIDHRRQLPELVAKGGNNVALVGKAADILETDSEVDRRPGVDTKENMATTIKLAGHKKLTVTNIQETDLAGHQQDPGMYCETLELVNKMLPELLSKLDGDDYLVITADHGNDPTIEHSFHTREYVPALWVSRNNQSEGLSVTLGSPWDSLANIGATLANHLGCNPVGHGEVLKP
ncbi:phosphopentomutase [Boudabousia marimammalium]|uniref:Metalloenzyme domain-containing protein n=1 Tax=Boudabousia marimammalium TaxID=156892 RepID=A0A1Q5PSC1_9ACTO|nr:phosphopentomutase [Boudabousia marimammalium]OKL50477.1 hypothetical protein BM477_00435 [Boudabousia marimammalium]